MIRPSTPVARLFGWNSQPPALAQRRARTPPEGRGGLKVGYFPAAMRRILHPLPFTAEFKLDGVTFCVAPHEVTARAGALWTIRPAAVSEAAVNSTGAVIRWVRMSLPR